MRERTGNSGGEQPERVVFDKHGHPVAPRRTGSHGGRRRRAADAQVHLRLLARAGRAVIAAREGGTDAAEAVEQAVGWAPFLTSTMLAPGTYDIVATGGGGNGFAGAVGGFGAVVTFTIATPRR